MDADDISSMTSPLEASPSSWSVSDPDDLPYPNPEPASKGRRTSRISKSRLPKAKARHTLLACLNCRPKKVKCHMDQGSQTCKRCLRFNLECVVPVEDERRLPCSKKMIRELQGQIQGLEDELRVEREKTQGPSERKGFQMASLDMTQHSVSDGNFQALRQCMKSMSRLQRNTILSQRVRTIIQVLLRSVQRDLAPVDPALLGLEGHCLEMTPPLSAASEEGAGRVTAAEGLDMEHDPESNPFLLETFLYGESGNGALDPGSWEGVFGRF